MGSVNIDITKYEDLSIKTTLQQRHLSKMPLNNTCYMKIHELKLYAAHLDATFLVYFVLLQLNYTCHDICIVCILRLGAMVRPNGPDSSARLEPDRTFRNGPAVAPTKERQRVWLKTGPTVHGGLRPHHIPSFARVLAKRLQTCLFFQHQSIGSPTAPCLATQQTWTSRAIPI